MRALAYRDADRLTVALDGRTPQDVPAPVLKLRFRWTSEPDPGSRWQALFRRAWPAYRAWFLRDGAEARPALPVCRARLEEYMPELVSVWEELCGLADDGEDVARMLSLYRPTPYISGCTQAVQIHPTPVLVRNYDYHPHACEATVVRSRWLGTDVLAASDCLWGVLDGVNEHGLAVALSFGGSPEIGDGFGIPLILRYVLESCTTVAEACATLGRVPCHMAYNVSLVDRAGTYRVAYLRPGAPAEFVRQAVATNHQRSVVWPEYVAATGSEERGRSARKALRDAEDTPGLVARFLEPPLFTTDYLRWHGTLYTATYHPEERAAEVYWPGASVRQSLDDFTEREFDVPYATR